MQTAGRRRVFPPTQRTPLLLQNSGYSSSRRDSGHPVSKVCSTFWFSFACSPRSRRRFMRWAYLQGHLVYPARNIERARTPPVLHLRKYVAAVEPLNPSATAKMILLLSQVVCPKKTWMQVEGTKVAESWRSDSARIRSKGGLSKILHNPRYPALSSVCVPPHL